MGRLSTVLHGRPAKLARDEPDRPERPRFHVKNGLNKSEGGRKLHSLT
jgi:hypothetical protein